MRRTSTLQAAAAALGVLAGFALAPAGTPPLERALDPYDVVAWRTPGLTYVGGLSPDAWDARDATVPAEPRVRMLHERTAGERTRDCPRHGHQS